MTARTRPRRHEPDEAHGLTPPLGAVAALVLLLVTGPARGGQEQTPVFGVDLNVVNLTASVEDRKGNLVTNLTAKDFTVKEDGRKQSVQVFARAHEPGQDELMALDLGLLMDTSESMLEELKLSQHAAVRFLDSIPRARELVTIFFDEEIRLSRYNSENQQGLFDRIHGARGGGNTALYDAIAVYLSRIQDSPGRKTLVLFSDGEDSTSSLNLGDVTALLRASPVTVYAIAFSRGLGASSRRRLMAKTVLRHLTSTTGGQVFSVTGWRDLGAIYQRILDDLGGQYVLGYVPSNQRRDGRYRKIEVKVKGRGLKVRHREGYYAPLAERDDDQASGPE